MEHGGKGHLKGHLHKSATAHRAAACSEAPCPQCLRWTHCSSQLLSKKEPPFHLLGPRVFLVVPPLFWTIFFYVCLGGQKCTCGSLLGALLASFFLVFSNSKNALFFGLVSGGLLEAFCDAWPSKMRLSLIRNAHFQKSIFFATWAFLDSI